MAKTIIWYLLCLMQLVMLLWSYFSVVFTDPGGVPPNYRPIVDEERGETDRLTGSEFNPLTTPDPTNSRIRYCRKCNQIKPPRCHHCSVCKLNSFSLLLLWDQYDDMAQMYFSSIFLLLVENWDKSRFLLIWNVCVFFVDFRWEVCAKNGSSLCVGC